MLLHQVDLQMELLFQQQLILLVEKEQVQSEQEHQSHLRETKLPDYSQQEVEMGIPNNHLLPFLQTKGN
jgi:hypothetical protein